MSPVCEESSVAVEESVLVNPEAISEQNALLSKDPRSDNDGNKALVVKEHETGEPPSLIKWTFGEGNQGVFVLQPTRNSESVLVVGQIIPWWGMVVARLGLRIHSVLLSDTRAVDLVGNYFGPSVTVGKRSNQSRLDIKITRDALRSCIAVALESPPKPRDVLSEMWVMSRVKIILVSHGRLIPPPAGWTLSRRTIFHGKVGG
jgi:hypothetical protein